MASIDDLAREVASLGVTGLVLIFFMAISGYAGAKGPIQKLFLQNSDAPNSFSKAH
jgi:hypothetical protein